MTNSFSMAEVASVCNTMPPMTAQPPGPSPWGAVRCVPLWVTVVACVAFPATILTAATVQPPLFRDKQSWASLLSINVLYLHAATFIVLSVIGLRVVGGLRPADLGLRPRQLPAAVGAAGLAWVLANLGSWMWIVCVGPPSAEVPVPDEHATLRLIGKLAANTLGTGLNEETFFRGFLFAQLYLRLARLPGGRWDYRALVVSAVVSSVLFAVLHFRTNILDLAQLTAGGLVGAGLYARTRNLFVGVILHGLFNAAPMLVPCSDEVGKVATLLGVLLVATLWPKLPSLTNSAGRTEPAEVHSR
jgi:membrane protease YdiL (CAAX protease family)